jgi:hypothetical protein
MLALRQHVEAAVDAHGLKAGSEYNDPEISRYMLALVIRDATAGEASTPDLEWTAPNNIGVWGGGPLYGVRKPSRQGDWIFLTPDPDESDEDWLARGDPLVQTVDAFVANTYETALPLAQEAVNADKDVLRYKRATIPSLLEAIQLIQDREPPRMLRQRRCRSC